MIGVVTTCYERPRYLRRMLASLSRSEFRSPVTLVLVDDGSGGRTRRIVSDFELQGVALYRILRPRLSEFGVHECLRLGWDFLLAEAGCDHLACLDSDALVSPDWLTRLENLHRAQRPRHPQLLVTGFNTLNHPVLAWHGDHCLKASCGGINLFFDADLYRELVRPSLAEYGWDWTLVHAMRERGYPILCTRPSVVEHIGARGHHATPRNYDRACDFPGPGRRPLWRRLLGTP